MLAVLEHLGLGEQRQLAEVISTWLMPQGKLILTVPSSKVDVLLKIMKSLGLIDGMSVDEHHGFNASDVPLIFNFSGLSLVKNEKFQFGLNNLFIFEHRA